MLSIEAPEGLSLSHSLYDWSLFVILIIFTYVLLNNGWLLPTSLGVTSCQRNMLTLFGSRSRLHLSSVCEPV